jgi:peptide/nickel transport system substrate-binding protein
LTPADVEYTFERLLVTDAGTGPSWMLWKPLFGNYSAWYLNAALADLGWPTNPTTGWNTKCDEAIDYAIESDATHVWFNLINVTLNSAGSQYFVPCEALLQVLSQSLGGILNQAWCVWHGDWPGMQVGDDWYMWHDPATSPLYTLPKGDTSSPGPHLNAALGTGPYMLDYWNRGAGNAWSIIKNPNYWEGWTVPFAHEGWAGYTIDGHVDRYTSYYIPEWSARKVRFLAGLSDFCDVPRYNISEVLGQPGILCVYPLPQLTCYACSFNFLVSDSSTYLGVMQPNSTFNQYGAPPNIMEDLNFRRALAHLFNYTNYLETAFLNEAVSPVTPIIPEISYYNSSIGQLENPVLDQRKKYGINGEPAGQLAYDSAFAVTYLQAAWGGQLWANGFTFDAVYNEGNLARQTAALLLKSAFDQINAQYGTKFTIKVTSIPWNSYRILQRTRFMPYCISSWFADFPDAHDFAYPFMHSLGFFSYLQGFKGVTGFPNQAFDDHVNAGFVTDSPVQRQGNYSWLQQNYVDFCPGFVTSQATSRHFERDWVRGWYYNPFYSGNYVYDLWMEFTGPDFRDVGIYAVRVSPNLVYLGNNNVTVCVDVGDSGCFPETFNVTAYADPNSTVNGDEITIGTQSLSLTDRSFTTLNFTWNTAGVSLGNYTISAYAWPVPGETRTDDNSYSDGVVQIIPVHDVAVTNVIPSQTVVVRGSLLDINVTAANLGDYSEDFNVTVYANGTYVGSQNITLATGSSATLIFTWNTMDVALGNYVLSAYAWPVPGEIHTDDNLYSDGIVRIIPHSPWHDVAVTGVSPSQDVVGQGVPLNINVAVANPGDFVETFNVTVYANSSYIDSRNVTLAVEGSETIIFTWNTTGVSLGNYAMSAYAWPVPGETRTDDNLYSDGVVQIRQLIHDVAITHVVPSLAVVGQGGSVSISVSVQNQGTDAETFNVTVYAGTITVETKQISLANGDSANLAFIWNTGDVAVGEYEVRAEASAVPGEADTADNTLIGGTVTVTIWTPEIYVYPSSCTFDALTSRVGTEFNVTVKVNNVMDMKAWQVKMSFNDSFINVTRWYEPTWDPTYVFYGKTTLPVPNPPQVHYVRGQGYIQGWLSCAAALFPAPDVGGGFTGSGLLCIIAFKITAIPPLNQTLSCVLNVSNFMQTFWIKAGEYSKRPFGDYGNGYYEMTFSGPSFHDVEVYGASVYPNWVYAGENDVTVWVDVWNRGCFPETFSVTVYADLNSTVIGDEITIDTKILSLQTQSFIALTFTWNTTGVPAGNYTISAVASLVPDEADLTNNLRVAGQVGIFVSVPCYDVNVTCPTTVTVNPSIFSYDPAYQARLINIGNVSIVSTGFEGALRVLGSSNGTIRLCVNQPDLDVYNFFLPLNGEVQVPLWLMFQPETHWETYNGDFTLELTVCGTHRRQLHIVGISIIVCQNGAYVVNNETVTFTWTLSGGSLVYLEAEATLPPGWTYSVDPAVGTLFETPHVVTVNITAPPDAKEGDMGYVTLRAYKNATGAMFWQFIYFASTDNKPPTIEAVQSPTLTTAGDLMFSTTVRDGSGISNVQFWYSVNDGSWNNETMQWGLGDTFNSTLYTSTVPHVPDNSVIRYYVIATDWLGNQTQSDVHTFVVKYDLAVTEVKTSKTMVGKGFPTRVDVTVANEGTLASASVKIAVYANKTLIYMQTLQLLAEGTTATLTFDWNTTDISKGNYVIAAFVIPILDETHTENNANASVVAVTIPGDVTGDVWVDMLDISILIEKFMTTPSHPLWDPNCNVNNDNSIDMADISIAIDNFMQT